MHVFIPPYATRVTDIDVPRLTNNDGVSVTAASSSVPSTYAPDTDKQHPHGFG